MSIATWHLFWLLDFLGWVFTGWSPSSATDYLASAGALRWLATSVHFYLLPLLAWRVWHTRRYDQDALPLALAFCLGGVILGRLLCPAALNVNFAYCVLPGAGIEWLDDLNRLPGAIYLPTVSAMIAGIAVLPAHFVLCRMTGRRRCGEVKTVPQCLA